MKEAFWVIPTGKNEDGEGIQYAYSLSPVVLNLLLKRGITTLKDAALFFSTSWEDLSDPYALFQMDQAVQRMDKALQNNEKIVIYGDYDVDGISSTSLLMKALIHMKADVSFYLPDRMTEGYGVNSDAIRHLHSLGTQLVITVDCGISALEPATHAKQLGMDMIITDHHECQGELPDAYAIINPKQPLCTYPEKNLCGAGIALKLAQGFMKAAFLDIRLELIALAALGTIADLVPLKGENRLIAKLGLLAINAQCSLGITALIQSAGIKAQEITAGHVGFQIGPRLNATGRLEKAHVAVDLLLSKDSGFCNQIASELSALNQARQGIEADILELCIEKVEKEWLQRGSKIIVLRDPSFHVGVVGIAASRLVERYHRPVILLSEQEGYLKGSARSVGDFNIFEAIQSTESRLIHFGGHKQAAGLKLAIENYDAFLEAIESYTEEVIKPSDLMRQVRIDQILEPQDVTLELADSLSSLEPFGMGNPKPIFAMRQLILEGVQWLGADKNHVKLMLNHEYRLFEALQFKTSFTADDFKLHSAVDLAFYVEKNQFRAVETLQLHIKDIRMKSIDYHGKNDLILAYCSRFLDELSVVELEALDKKTLKGLKILEKNKALDLEASLASSTSKIVFFTAQSVINLYFQGNGEATPWLKLLHNPLERRLFICPDLAELEGSAPNDLIFLDAPLDPVKLEQFTALKYPLYFDLHSLKQQLQLVEHLTIERNALGEWFKKASLAFAHSPFHYKQWMDLFKSFSYQGILTLRLFIDGGLIEVQSDAFVFKVNPEKFNLYDLRVMKNLKIYRINLAIAIEYCEGNKLL